MSCRTRLRESRRLSSCPLRSTSSAVSFVNFAKAARASAASTWDSTSLLSQPRAIDIVWHAPGSAVLRFLADLDHVTLGIADFEEFGSAAILNGSRNHALSGQMLLR